jgi:predicted dehydrogenase
MENEKLRFAIVGAGSIAGAYVEAFNESEIASLVAVADLNGEAASSLASRVEGCEGFESTEQLIEIGDFDAAIVCTPPSTHESISISLLNSGRHVLCEKPLTIGIESARRMVAASRSAGRLLTMASKFRYVDDVVAGREIINSGIIGDVVLFENAFTSKVDMSRRWNSVGTISGGGVLIDNGTHSLDLTRFFLGPLGEVQVVEGKRIQGLDVEETVRVFAKSARGAMGTIDLSWSINKELDSYINVYCTDGVLQIGWKESRYKQTGANSWRVFGNGYNKVQAFRHQIENFSKAVLGEEPLRINETDAIASVEAIDAAYAALRQSQWTAVGRLASQSVAEEVLELEGIASL